MTAADLSAEADVDGDALLRVGAAISVSGLDARFNGKYYIIGVSHRFQQGADGDWQTLLRLVRAGASLRVRLRAARFGGREDSNLHGIATASPSRRYV